MGNERAGKHAGYFYSLINSTKLSGVEPFAWLLDLIECRPKYRQGDAFSQVERGEAVKSDELDELLPDRWFVTQPDCKWDIDSIRREERKRQEVLKRRKRK